MTTVKKKRPPKTASAGKTSKGAAALGDAGAAKGKRSWLVPVLMIAVLLGAGAQIYLRTRYLASLKFDMIRFGRIVPHGLDRGQIFSVLSVVADKQGQVFVQEERDAEPRLQRFDAQLSPEALVYQATRPEQKIVHPADMDLGPDGSVYVLLKDGRVQVIDNDLKYQRSIKTNVPAPSAISVNSAGRIYVASSAENKVVFFDSQGVPEGEFGAPGTQSGDLVNPSRLRCTADDEIVVIERTENGLRGKIFRPNHSLRKTFLIENLQYCEPMKLGVTGDGKAFLNDHLGTRGIVAFDIKTGKFFGESQATKDGQKFVSPGGLGASRYGRTVFVHSVVGLMACMAPVPGEENASGSEGEK